MSVTALAIFVINLSLRISNISDEFEMLSDVSCCTDSIFMTEDHDVSCSRACSELTIDHCYEFDSRTCRENCSLCNGGLIR